MVHVGDGRRWVGDDDAEEVRPVTERLVADERLSVGHHQGFDLRSDLPDVSKCTNIAICHFFAADVLSK